MIKNRLAALYFYFLANSKIHEKALKSNNYDEKEVSDFMKIRGGAAKKKWKAINHLIVYGLVSRCTLYNDAPSVQRG